MNMVVLFLCLQRPTANDLHSRRGIYASPSQVRRGTVSQVVKPKPRDPRLLHRCTKCRAIIPPRVAPPSMALRTPTTAEQSSAAVTALCYHLVWVHPFAGNLFLLCSVYGRYNECRDKRGDVMTTTRAATLRAKWKQRAIASQCEHRYLELEGMALGHSADNYYCIVCGECVVRNHYDFLLH